MTWTKRDLVNEAFAEIALAGYTFDIQPDEQEMALRRLDAMMATWESIGIRIGYALPDGPGASDLDQDAGIPDGAAETIFQNLAVRIASGFGKAVSPDIKVNARLGYNALLAKAAMPAEQQLKSMPSGSGNRRFRYPFSPVPDPSPLQVGGSGNLDILE